MRLLFASLLLLSSAVASAQTPIVLSSPTTVNAQGQPKTVLDVFVRNADGSIASITGAAGSTGSSTPTATEATQLANKQALADLLTAQQATTSAQGVTTSAVNGSNTRLDTLTTAQGATTTAINGSNTRLDALATAQAATNTRLDTLNAAMAGGSLTREDAKVLSGQGYTVSTAIVAVSAGNTLSVELSNPAGSGVNYVISSRVFSNNVVGGNAPLEYTRYAATATFPTGTPTSVTVNNRLTSGPASTATFRYMMGAAAPSGTVSSSGFIPTNGEEKRIHDIVIIAPGSKLLYAVGGSGGGLAATARIAVTFLFYTNPV
jgi:hypothetical protein